jgi:hypothetical protein
MIEDILNPLQNQLDNRLLNRNIQNLDEYNYNLLVNSILNIINSAIQESNLTIKNIDHEFNESYILIRCNIDISKQTMNLVIYLAMETNIIINVEASIS